MAMLVTPEINSDTRATKRPGDLTQAAFLCALSLNYPAGGELLDLSGIFRSAFATAGVALVPNPGNPTTGALVIGLERVPGQLAQYKARCYEVGVAGVLSELAAGAYPINASFEVVAIGIPSTDLG